MPYPVELHSVTTQFVTVKSATLATANMQASDPVFCRHYRWAVVEVTVDAADTDPSKVLLLPEIAGRLGFDASTSQKPAETDWACLAVAEAVPSAVTAFSGSMPASHNITGSPGFYDVQIGPLALQLPDTAAATDLIKLVYPINIAKSGADWFRVLFADIGTADPLATVTLRVALTM